MSASRHAYPLLWIHGQALAGAAAAERRLARLSLLTRFGLGRRRTLDQLIAFTGLDLRGQRLLGDRCQELHWVPFQPDRCGGGA